jgi:hypothetical protein
MCSVASALGGQRLRMGGYVAGREPRKGCPSPEGVDVGHPLDLHQLRSLTARPEA